VKQQYDIQVEEQKVLTSQIEEISNEHKEIIAGLDEKILINDRVIEGIENWFIADMEDWIKRTVKAV